MNGRVAASTQNQALAAILYLYETLKRPLAEIDALRAKRPAKIRTAPTRAQVRDLRRAIIDTEHTPARLLVDLVYGCGLRVSEPLGLRIRDVCVENKYLLIRGAKGGKDRVVPIPETLINRLSGAVSRAKDSWKTHVALHPGIGVTLPSAIERKYPNASLSSGWFWLFPAASICEDPRSGKMVKYHLLPDALQRAVYRAARRIGAEHVITPHSLRHAYATHSREPIERLRILMGHYSINTTAGYRHPDADQTSNPLDDLLGPDTCSSSCATPS
ncbi:recombinase XerD [Opitutaceae bacterium EW11]|nr:recombinase XerD [Opitutaceae bacterium EW11]